MKKWSLMLACVAAAWVVSAGPQSFVIAQDTLNDGGGSVQTAEEASLNELVPNAFGDSAADLVFTPVTPCRVFDTRFSAAGILAANTQQNFKVTGAASLASQGGSASGCGIPSGKATAVIINFAAVTPTGGGNLRAWAVANPQPSAPLAAVMNFSAVLNALANGVAVPICNPAATSCTLGDLRLQADVSSVHVVGDVLGYFHRTGQTLSGVISARYVPHTPNPFFLVAASYPEPYPLGATLPTFEYVPGAGTATCPGAGLAAAGRLCVYGVNTSNLRVTSPINVSYNTRYGFSLDVFTETPTIPAWIIANWTVTVP